jgi:hypothetical protein
VDSVHGFPLGKYFLKILILDILRRSPSIFQNQPAVQEFIVRSKDLKNIYKKVPSLRKIHKNSSKTSKIHIFSTTTPNLVIVVPKFLESLPLSFYAFIYHMFVAFID